MPTHQLPPDIFCIGFIVLDRLLGVSRASDAVAYARSLHTIAELRALFGISELPIILNNGCSANDHPAFDYCMNIDTLRLLPTGEILDADLQPICSPPTAILISEVHQVSQAVRILETNVRYPEISIPSRIISQAARVAGEASLDSLILAAQVWDHTLTTPHGIAKSA